MSFVHHDAGGARGPRPAGFARFAAILRTAIRLWALLGGVIVAAIAVMTTASALFNLFLGRPLPGDYELTKHFIAIAIFTFLPYCQATGANVTVDIFTEGMGPRAKSAMAVFSSLFAIAFALLLLRQMSLGFEDYVRYLETTATLGLPLWTAFPPILVSLVLLLAAAAITTIEALGVIRRPPAGPATAE